MYATFLLVYLASAPVALAAGPNPCSPGLKIADDCFSLTDVGCCTEENSVRWCLNGVLCEASCKGKGACGWKAGEGVYDCAAKPEGDPSCDNPFSCFVGGCAPAWEDKGCCGCPCEDCVCSKDPYCCKVAWDPVCVDLCKACGGCGGGDGCTSAPTPGCAGCACELCVCEKDPSCCTNKWDSLCVLKCALECDGGCEPCKPNCSGKQCGPDGCFGICGVCEPGYDCVKGACQKKCVKSCVNKQCGDDGCGGSCGTCTAPNECKYGKCVPPPCEPNCDGKVCGDNGCGGKCGTCPEEQACMDGQCVEGVCVPKCQGKDCGDDGCGGVCGWCKPGFMCNQAQKCEIYCVPKCKGKECGDDGCNGSCGSCSAGLLCEEGKCEIPCFPVCEGAQCGSDHAGGVCGTCQGATPFCVEALGFQCAADCIPNCTGKECGDDGCGGSCGPCPGGWFCNSGLCSPNCIPQCLVPPLYFSAKQCGCDECGGVCGVCPPGYKCAPGYICVEDKCSCDDKFCGVPAEGCPNTCGTCPPDKICDMETAIDPETNVCELCQPNCTKGPEYGGGPKLCGDDGCGGSCGTCNLPDVCDEDPNDGDNFYFQCAPCQPNCFKNDMVTLKACGSDGCGGSCGLCPQQLPSCQEACPPENPGCDLFTCVACTDNCMAPPNFIYPMECGPKNCPNGCLELGLGPCKFGSDCPEGLECNALTGQCVDCDPCKVCPVGYICDAETEKDPEIYVCDPCQPSCLGKECGPNGCNGSCGMCPGGYDCVDGKCIKQCNPTALCLNKSCGPNGCPSGCLTSGAEPCGAYGKCPEGFMCDPKPNVCVSCTGSCGSCAETEYCAKDYTCQPLPADPCANKECGPNGRGGSCGECSEGFVCEEGKCVEDVTNPDGAKPEVVEQPEEVVSSTDADVEECPEGQKLVDGECVDDEPVTCPSGWVKNKNGQCEECAPPNTIIYGKCIANKEEKPKDEGCGYCSYASSSSPSLAALLLALCALVIGRMGNRTGTHRRHIGRMGHMGPMGPMG